MIDLNIETLNYCSINMNTYIIVCMHLMFSLCLNLDHYYYEYLYQQYYLHSYRHNHTSVKTILT
jgi:hypothetical protein